MWTILVAKHVNSKSLTVWEYGVTALCSLSLAELELHLFFILSNESV